VLSVSAHYLLRSGHEAFARASPWRCRPRPWPSCPRCCNWSPATPARAGWRRHQPAKLAAFEGLFETTERAPLYLFGWVNDREERVQVGVAVPGLLSWLVHGDAAKPVTGLRAFAPADRPPVNIVFQFYHVMVAIGFGLIGLSLLATACLRGGHLYRCRWLLRLLVLSVLGPQIGQPVRLVRGRDRAAAVDRVRPAAHLGRPVAGR
jgi:cytochrome d ubiquinol oxidase subunit I